MCGTGTACTGGHCTKCTCPLILDTAGNGYSLTDAAQAVDFDFFGNGTKIRIAWTAPGSGNAWLALDRNGNGRIDSGQELFGDITPQPQSTHPNGFLALAVFDKRENGGNGDGIIDARDAVFSKLLLWIDKNHNGVSEPDELYSLPALGVISIDLHYQEARFTDLHGNRFHYKSTVDDAARTLIGRSIYDVFLAINK